jgi:hypothetical protein
MASVPGEAEIVAGVEAVPERAEHVGQKRAVPCPLADLDLLLRLLVKHLNEPQQQRQSTNGIMTGQCSRRERKRETHLDGIERTNVDVVVKPLLHLSVPRSDAHTRGLTVEFPTEYVDIVESVPLDLRHGMLC